MEKAELLYEGKAKKVYAMSEPNYCMVEYKDDATAFNGLKKGTITGKGIVNNKMSNFMFKLFTYIRHSLSLLKKFENICTAILHSRSLYCLF